MSIHTSLSLKSMVNQWFTVVFTVDIIHSMDFGKHIMACLHHDSIIYNNFTALKTLCAMPVYPFLQTRVVSDLFTVSMLLTFPERHTLGVIYYGTYSN